MAKTIRPRGRGWTSPSGSGKVLTDEPVMPVDLWADIQRIALKTLDLAGFMSMATAVSVERISQMLLLPKFSFLTICLLILVACGGGGSSGPTAPATGGDSAKMIEKYLQAKITGDEQTIRSLLCAAMEKDLQLEATTFLGTSGVKLDGMTCQATGAGKVTCQGQIVADYGQEKNEFPLTTYTVVQEDGEWKYCGETR